MGWMEDWSRENDKQHLSKLIVRVGFKSLPGVEGSL